MYDAIIVGAGPAGLSAALVLGRCRRRILVIDTGRPRNAASHGLHGFLTRDGILPSELLRIGREQLAPYGVQLLSGEVTEAGCVEDGFEICLADGSSRHSRTLLIATGVVDELPSIQGIREFYGRSVFHCPYCDGWEVRDQPLAIYGKGKNGAGLSLSLKTWSHDVALCTDGPSGIYGVHRRHLERQGIRIFEQPIARLEGSHGRLERVVFENGESLERRALFFSTGQHQRAELARKLGCRFTRKGTVKNERDESTGVPGLYVIGDASHDVQFAIVAAAEGAKAAVAVNKLLQSQEGKSPG